MTETEKSRKTINSWVEEKTREKIKDLIPQGGLSSETVLVITNAIYFKGVWETQFGKKDTKEANFTISKTEKVKVPMMYLKEAFRYYADENLQAVQLPYKGGESSMLVLLPKKNDGLKTVEDMLTHDNLGRWFSKMEMRMVPVYLPKFKMTWGSFDLKDSLMALGMHDAFKSGKADFSGINSKNNVFISTILHKAFVEVNEEGTEAAAATATELCGSATPPDASVFRADHPFVFIIQDNRSGSILFLGRVMNPVAQ
jgi:serpin B